MAAQKICHPRQLTELIHWRGHAVVHVLVVIDSNSVLFADFGVVPVGYNWVDSVIDDALALSAATHDRGADLKAA